MDLEELLREQHYLYISSHFFLLPVFLAIYQDRYDILLISVSILITSILRWGNNTQVIYQYIDHNWVKIVFVYLLYSLFIMFYEFGISDIEIVYILGITFSICFYFLIETISYYMGYYRWVIPFHLYVHFYSILSFILLLNYNYDFLKILKTNLILKT